MMLLAVDIGNSNISLGVFRDARLQMRAKLSAQTERSADEYAAVMYDLLRINGVAREEFDIVPFPVNCPELLFNYVPREARFYMTLYDQWSLEKKAMLEGLGCDVEVMWQRTDAERLTSGTEVRDLIRAGKPWQHLVPPFVYEYMTSRGIDRRL